MRTARLGSARMLGDGEVVLFRGEVSDLSFPAGGGGETSTSPLDHVTYPMMHLVSTPPGVGQTDVCENITFARFTTRAVITSTALIVGRSCFQPCV